MHLSYKFILLFSQIVGKPNWKWIRDSFKVSSMFEESVGHIKRLENFVYLSE